MNDILYIVIPCFNEEDVLPVSAEKMNTLLNDLINRKKISTESKIVFVDDGSKDRTWEILSHLYKTSPNYNCIKLSRNKGHQNALLAGLMYSKEYADMVISIDADLQDDIYVIEEMIDSYYQGFEIVYGVRTARTTDSFLKRFSAETYYKLMIRMGVELVFNHADFRLMSKRSLESLSEYHEVNIFLRGIIPQLGFATCTVGYERKEREAGESKYPISKMLSFAFDGITSFSTKPIKLILGIGMVMVLVSIIALIYSLVSKFMGDTVSGWTSIMISIWLIGGIQTLCLGIIGEYIGKVYSESKKRPKYIIDTVLSENNN